MDVMASKKQTTNALPVVDKRFILTSQKNTVGPIPLAVVNIDNVGKIRKLASGNEVDVATDFRTCNYKNIILANVVDIPHLRDEMNTIIEVRLKS